MLIVDIILLIIILGFFIRGWQQGLIRTLAGLIGIILGIIIASHLYIQLAEWLTVIPFFEHHESLSKIISFIAILFVVNGIIGVGGWLIEKTFNILSFVPFLKTINKLAGGVLGLISGIILLGIAIVIITAIENPLTYYLLGYLQESYIAPWLVTIIGLLSPLWPEVIKKTTKIIQSLPYYKIPF